LINTGLILFEGIPGSGKTTTAQLLYKYLNDDGTSANVFVEGCDHPIDLSFHAFLSKDEYKILFLKYPSQADWLYQNSIFCGDYVLISYKTLELQPRNDGIVAFLRSKEFCYTDHAIVSFNTFTEVFLRRFEQYVATATGKDAITIFESVLFQHQIHDINRLYPRINDHSIIEYIEKLANTLMPLNPILFYISQDSVQDSLEYTASIRSKPKWSSLKTIEYYMSRKELELKVIERLPFQTVILNNTDRNWNRMFNSIVDNISRNRNGGIK